MHLYVRRNPLAIFHLNLSVVSRARGQRVVASAAARSASKLRDEHYGLTHNFTTKAGVVHTEIMAPGGAPAWVFDREVLWNRVESCERRKDSQLARALDLGLPVELTQPESVQLVRDYVAREFVSQGMIADFSIRRADPDNPVAQILLTLRPPTDDGFGPKARHWNQKSNLMRWRSAWAERANQHLARAGHAVRIDHRTLEAQHIELTPARRIGLGHGTSNDHALPGHLAERVAEQRKIARENGRSLLEDPTAALRALTRQRSIFTRRDLERFLKSRTADAEQLDAVLLAILNSTELVAIGPAEPDLSLFTSRDLVEAEKSLMKRAAAMAVRRGHGLLQSLQSPGSPDTGLSESQRATADYLLSEGDLKTVIEGPHPARGALLASVRRAWEAQGFRVRGAALSEVAVKDLDAFSGIKSLTLVRLEQEWAEGLDPFMPDDVVVLDGAEMIGLKQLERTLAAADKARAKVILVGEAQQFQAMGDLSPLQGLLARIGPSQRS